MSFIRRSPISLLLIAALALITACASSKSQPDLTIDFDDDKDLSVALSTVLAREVMDGFVGSHLDCKGEIDSEFETMLRTLERKGGRSDVSYRDEDTTVVAKRRGGKLHLAIKGSGSGSIDATMPWAVAECLLGHETDLDDALHSSIRIKVTGDNGKTYSFKLN